MIGFVIFMVQFTLLLIVLGFGALAILILFVLMIDDLVSRINQKKGK